MAKKRVFDYSFDDMAELAGVPRKKFGDNLNRICDEYGFDLSEFKVDPERPKSDYFFPPEIAEPLALLVKHHDLHPYGRRNADKRKTTASAIATYNEAVLCDIDNSLHPIFRDAIYGLRSHLTSKEITDWAKPLVRELTHFLVNNTIQDNANVGEAICFYTRMLNEMNYNLHRGAYTFKRVSDENMSYAIENYGICDDTDEEKQLAKENMSLDNLLVALVRWGLISSERLRENDFPGFDEIVDEYLMTTLLSGSIPVFVTADGNQIPISDVDSLNSLPVEEQREVYLRLVMGNAIDYGHVKINMESLKKKTLQRSRWKPIDEQINDGTFDGDNIVGEYHRALRIEIEKTEKHLEQLKHELETVKSVEAVRGRFENDRVLRQRQDEYVKHCKYIDEHFKDLFETVDGFVGQALIDFLNE